MELKSIIKNHGLKMADVAREWGVPTQNVVQVCRKDGNPSFNTLKKIADTLHITVSELVSEMEGKSSAKLICPNCGHKLRVLIEPDR